MRRTSCPAALVAAAAACGVLAAPASALAQSPTECAQSYEHAQRQRIHNQLRASRAELEVCASAACSANLRGDCATWLSEVKLALPSVVLKENLPPRVAPATGTATLDGEPIPNPFSGLPIDVDPGPHVLRFERPGIEAVTLNVTTREGEKGREVVVDWPPPMPPSTSPAPPPSPSDVGPARPIFPLVVAVAGVALAAAGAGFELWGLSKRAAVDACQPLSCSLPTYDSDKDSAQHTFLAGDILLGAGIAAAATGAILYLIERPGPRQPTVGVAPIAGGVITRFVASF